MSTQTLIFVDVDGVLNVGLSQGETNTLMLSLRNMALARRVQLDGRASKASKDAAESLFNLAAAPLSGEAGTLQKYMCPDHGISDLLVERLAKLLLAAGPSAHVVLSSSWRHERHAAKRDLLERKISNQEPNKEEKWVGWGTKLVQYRKALRLGLAKGQIAASDPVLLIDGWDCVLVGPASEFIEKLSMAPFTDGPQPWYAGERICGPDFFKANRIDAVYPDPGTPWRYPNAGCMTGRAEPVLKLIEDLLDGAGDGDTFPEDGDDQGRLHEHLLELGENGQELPYFVDSECRIFQCLYEAEPQWHLESPSPTELLPRLRNLQTRQRPIVLHGNGHTGRWFMCNLWREMDFLRRVGLTPSELAHLPHDGPVAPGTVPDEATEKNWMATFQLYRIIEKQMALARVGVEWDPWKIAAQQNATAQPR